MAHRSDRGGGCLSRIILFLLIITAALIAVNSETDIFTSPENYAPALCEKYPTAAEKVKSAAAKLSDITDRIPSFSEIAAIIRNDELPIDPEDVAHNAFIENSPMLSFYPKENISVTVQNGSVSVFGVSGGKDRSHLIVNINTLSGEELLQTPFAADNEGKFNKTIKLPQTSENTLEISVYTGRKQFGEYTSWVLDYLYAVRENGVWRLERSPVYEHNRALYIKDKSRTEALRATSSIQSDAPSIISIANEITKDLDSDYDKARALHDWVASYLYYDHDSLNSGQTLPYSAMEVIASKKAVCLGYATLYASLCRAAGLPCNVVSGYALGIDNDTRWNDSNVNTEEQNHAWNEVYADGRWIIADPTWDSPNKAENGEMIKGDSVNHLYFDANLEFFSVNHKIIEYSKRR